MAIPMIRELAASKPLNQIADDIMGVPMIPFKATLFAKTGKANWLVAFHQDTALPVEQPKDGNGWGPHSTKDGVTFSHAPTRALTNIIALRLHFDSSSEDNGPLRVIPNSHHRRIEVDAEFQQAIDDGVEMTCLVEKGGVIAMSPLIIHASSKCITNRPRRVLHVEYTSRLDVDAGVKLAVA
jgi:ectoine hydroxylase-related dioxygenase (phytanoyl-CoA dioxygenase family)